MANELRTEFTQNADRLGFHHFKLIKRSEKVCLYQRNKADGSLFGFEVFVVNSESFPDGNGQRTEVRETYPSAKSFGRTAWFCQTLKRAETRFNGLCR